MGKLADKLTKRIIAIALSLAMVMSNMTVYASEFSEPAAQTEEAVDDTETGSVELPSTEDETVQDDTAQNEGTQDEGTQDEGDADEEKPQDEDTSDEGSDPENNEEGGDAYEPEESDEDGLEAEEPYSNIEAEEPKEATNGKPTVWLVGDSTVCAFNDNYYYPRYGYGTQIGNYLDGTYTIENLAASGRSSKSYLTESADYYARLTSEMTSEDVLIIGFGHNDEKVGDTTFTDPNGDWNTEGSFANSLYKNYVKVAKDKGAEVILCTPIVRRAKGEEFTNDELHVTSSGDYPEAIRQLGIDQNIPVVDLTDLTHQLYLDLGGDETLYLHAWLAGVGGDDDPGNPATVDNTHLNIYGAKMVAWLFASAVKDASSSSLLGQTELAKHIDLSAGAPTKANDLIKNPDYVKSVYTSPEKGSEIWSKYEIDDIEFEGTVFGSSISTSKTYSTFETDSDGNMHIAVSGNKGKIEASSDGIAMYYYRVPANTLFKLSARATLTDYDANNQVAFGLMARDDMYIDTSSSTINSDYVVAGTLCGTSAGNCFYRQGTKLSSKVDFTTETLEKGKSYDLSIVYNGDGYECTFGNEPTRKGGFDFQLLSEDPDYVYIGMFVARNADVTYSNIYLEIDGEVVADNRSTDPEYSITVTSGENGIATANKNTATENAIVFLTATPNEGYMFKEWQITVHDKEGNVNSTSIDNQYTMPAADVDIKAVFEELRTEWDFTDDSLSGNNGIEREGNGKTTTFYVSGLFVDATDGKWNSTGNDGAEVSKDTIITIPVAKSNYAKVTVNASIADYTLDYVNDATNAEVEEFYVDASSGEILLEITGPDNTTDTDAVNKIKTIKVEPADDYTPPAKVKNIDVWDFGGKVEANTALYSNNITPGWYKKTGIVAEGGSFKETSPTSFGDLTMYYESGDRLYTNVSALSKYNAGSYSYAQNKYDDYSPEGAWYANGSGNSSRRYVIIDNVQAGDKIVAYMGSHNSGSIEFTFEYQGSDGEQKESGSVENQEFAKFEFIAEYDGTYKIYANGDGKPMYHRIMRFPVVTVSGTVNKNSLTTEELAGFPNEYTVKFYNEDRRVYTDAVVDNTNDTFTVDLTPGYSYRAVLGATGYGFATETRTVEVTTDACATCKIENVNLDVKVSTTYIYSGTIAGFAEDYDTSDIDMVMVPDASFPDANREDVIIDKDNLTFTVSLEPDTDYTILMHGVYDYEVIDPDVVNNSDGSDYTNETITVALKTTYAVEGDFIGLSDSAEVTELVFRNVDDDYTYEATVNDNGNGYTINLRNGSYIANATVQGYTTNTHVVVNSKNTKKDLMFVSTTAKDNIAYIQDIYVGYPDEDNNYNTVSEAVEACGLMTRTGDQRVTVHIAPGEYREQIIIDTPNISLVNDTDKEVLLTWYYGIGYTYYSADSTGYYNPENAHDKYEKKPVSKWGVSVYIKSNATAFRAEGITFENSFNRYITDEELEDGVEANPDGYSDVSETYAVRNYNTDVQSKANTERASAIAIEADKAEFKNCGFYSSQDTLYTGAGIHLYFKNCIIEGQTDYIFGDGDCVFDACELSWKGYNGTTQGGYITAVKDTATYGYLFRNCIITANSNLDVTAGYFGRPWGAGASVTFLNTKLADSRLIEAAGWKDWSSDRTAADANFREYNTTTIDGTPVSTTSRVTGTVITDSSVAMAILATAYFGTWTPYYYVAEAESVEFARKPSISDNGDANLPKPGHTLTVNYSLGDNDDSDVSIIQWYIVNNAEDEGTLVKSSVASVDKTYQIEAAAIGKYIKVKVTPQTISGKTGEPEAFVMAAKVEDGYENPSGGSDITIGDGINIFLAGDSTVKDYSPNGMYETVGENLGSWGEFLQSFFNESQVKIQNYANGGRSTRTFINEGSLAKIEENIEEGDYLFIQFGHNDSSDVANPDRYVPVGTPDASGVYPVTAGTKDANGVYPDGGDGTFKWFLKQYIEVAKSKNAIPVLVTPVSRMYYTSDGTIRAHHDDSHSSNDAYVVAMKQLADEENVLLIDGFALTKSLFEDAWKADGNNSDDYGAQIMGVKTDGSTDQTHNNKLGGMIEAMLIAKTIQSMNLDISRLVKAPSKVQADTLVGDIHEVFRINASNVLTAYDITTDYADEAPYWEGVGQTLIDDIKDKAIELNPDKPKDPDGSGGNIVTTDGGIEIRNLDSSYPYTGAKITPVFDVVDNGIKINGEFKVLSLGVDYTVKYTNNKNEGAEATVTVTGKGNYSGKTVTGKFQIVAASDLESNKDIEREKLADLTGAKIATISPVTYNGNKQYPDFTLTLKGKDPVEYTYNKEHTRYEKKDNTDMDVYVAVSNNINKGTATILLTGADNAKGKATTLKKTFKITAVDLSKAESKLVIDVAESAVYAVKGATPEVKVTYQHSNEEGAEPVVLKSGVDYTIKYSANKKLGNGKFTITGKGNYAKKATGTNTFTITQLDLADVTVKAAAAYTDLKAGKVKVTVLDGNGDALKTSQYKVEVYKDENGTTAYGASDKLEKDAKIYVKAVAKDTVKNNCLKGETELAEFTVGTNIAKAKVVLKNKSKTYTGAPIELGDDDLTVTIKESGTTSTLKIGDGNFKIVSYSNNVNKGTATAVIQGTGSYSGIKTIKFKITAKEMKPQSSSTE